mmetsp:Transcript_84259/g.176333  ORF Transcript_84259/g.176333 Transcript_84259/m.176333 type:complete len:103 (+) Transcript_84259:631-939(+)
MARWLFATPMTRKLSVAKIRVMKMASTIAAVGVQSVVRFKEEVVWITDATSAPAKMIKDTGTAMAANMAKKAAKVPECLHHPYQKEAQIRNIVTIVPTRAQL